MRSPRKQYVERINALCDESTRFVDVGARIRVYKRGSDGKAEPSHWLPWVYGGRYDSFISSYVGPPERYDEIPVHTGQVRLLESIEDPGIRRVLAMGSPGGGKTMNIVVVAAILSLSRPHSIGGVVAPTQQRLKIVWRKFLELARPKGWVRAVRPGDGEIHLVNGTILQFVSAKRQSDAVGSPIAGNDWHWAVEDEQQHIDNESCREVEFRGRISGAAYKIFSSATNENLHEFQLRVAEYEAGRDTRVVRFSGPENCFTDLSFWESFRERLSADEYARVIEARDIPSDGRVYPQFQYRESTQPLPDVGRDITAQITAAKYRHPYHHVVGTDFGRRVTASVILKAFAGSSQDERIWYVLDDVTTEDKTTDWHADELAKWFLQRGIQPADVLVLGDPHPTGYYGESQGNKEADRSDFLVMKRRGFSSAVRTNHGDAIPRKHRFSMVNALLRDSTGRRRLFLVATQSGTPQPKRTAESLGHLMYGPSGEPETHGKGSPRDITHWGDALGHGLMPFEKFRGQVITTPVQRTGDIRRLHGTRNH